VERERDLFAAVRMYGVKPRSTRDSRTRGVILDLTGLDLLLEAAQVVGQLRREIPAGELLRRRTEVAQRRVVLQLDDQLRAAVARRVREDHGRAGLFDLGPQLGRRPPCLFARWG
jgi:hypothetical protein